jgi:uncharacterized membrane protein YkgB
MLHRRFLIVLWSASARRLQVQEARSATIVPFTPDGRVGQLGRFLAMAGNVLFLLKDIVPLAVSFCLLKQDFARVTPAAEIA